jgi:hypothetical protein
MRSTPHFRRIILGLRPGRVDRAAVELLAEMARWLGAALQGVFIEDASLREFTATSRMREFQLLSREWRTVDADRMAEELELAARSAKRVLEEIALERGIESGFEVIGREAVASFLRLAQPRDILVVTSPDGPQEQLAPPAFRFEVSGKSLSTTMLLPKRATRRKGPVVGMALAEDSTLRVAASIAHAAGEKLLFLVPEAGPDDEAFVGALRAAGLGRDDVQFRRLSIIDTQSFLAALEPLDERVIVLPRMRSDSGGYIDADIVVSRRSVPVMIVDPLATFES